MKAHCREQQGRGCTDNEEEQRVGVDDRDGIPRVWRELQSPKVRLVAGAADQEPADEKQRDDRVAHGASGASRLKPEVEDAVLHVAHQHPKDRSRKPRDAQELDGDKISLYDVGDGEEQDGRRAHPDEAERLPGVPHGTPHISFWSLSSLYKKMVHSKIPQVRV